MTSLHDQDPHQTAHQLPPELEGYEVTPEDLAFFGSPEMDDDTKERLEGILAETALSDHELPAYELRGDEDDDFVQSLRTFQRQFNVRQDANVIYPGSSTHVGVARAFGKNQVTHVDPDIGAAKALHQHGYKVIDKKIEDYEPDEKGDVVVALNSYGNLTQAEADRLIKEGGYLVANNYTGWANDAAHLENFSLVGAMLPAYAEGGTFLEGEDIPQGATDIVTNYYLFPPEGGVKRVTADTPGASPDESARYPDGLFVFRKLSS